MSINKNLCEKYRNNLKSKIGNGNFNKQYKLTTNGDNIYLELAIANRNPEKTTERASAQIVRINSLINNPYKYYLSVIRFKIPGYFIPLHVMPVIPNPLDPTDINYSVYSITLEYNGESQQVHLNFISTTGENANQINPPTINTNGTINQDQNTAYYYMFEYQQMIDMFNTAFNTAFNRLTNKPLGSESPKLIYNNSQKLFSLIGQIAYYEINLRDEDRINVYMNIPAHFLFPAFDVITKSFHGNAPDGKDIQYIFKNNLNNFWYPPNIAQTFPALYYEMKQQYRAIGNWLSAKSVIFESIRLPTRNEFILSGDNFDPIITDFELSITADTNIREPLQYNPASQYRLIDLLGNTPIYNIDIRLYWVDINGNKKIILIPYNQLLTIKMIFVKKDLFKNYDPIEYKE